MKPDGDGAAQRVASATRERGNLIAALRAGIITSSTKAELLACEARVADVRAGLERACPATPARLVPLLC